MTARGTPQGAADRSPERRGARRSGPCLVLLFLALFLTARNSVVATERDATRTIAMILIEFVHTCTPSQRDALQAIVEAPAATAHQRLLASARLDVEHQASVTD